MSGCAPTCVDLILTNNLQVFVNSEVIPSPDGCCHDHIIQGNFYFSVPCSHPYKREIWKYYLDGTDMIKQSIKLIDWSALFHNKTVDEMTICFTETIL